MDGRAFCPGHITVFFVPRGGPRDPPEQRGSLGAGFCIESGVAARATTTGAARQAPRSRSKLPFALAVVDNGRRVARPVTTRLALADLVRRAGPSTTFPARLNLRNEYTLPLGAGFGVSGACALTATLLANELMDLGLARRECVAAAHCGEVEALSGLGDVGPQSLGGFEVRTREGPPPLGRILRPGAPSLEVLLVSFGPRPTRAFLRDATGKRRLARTGRSCLRRLRADPSVVRAAVLGREFAETLGLVSPRARRLLSALGEGAPASVAMLGDSVFAVGPGYIDLVPRGVLAGGFVEVSRLAKKGARLA
jgi:pantoate kinase